jgi:opacity protein-like surface antigen
MNVLTKLIAAAGAAVVLASPLAAAAQGYHNDGWRGREDQGRGDSSWRDRQWRGDRGWRSDGDDRRSRDNDDRRWRGDGNRDWRNRGG